MGLKLFDIIYGSMLNSDSVLNRLNSINLVLLFISSISVKLADCSSCIHLKGYIYCCLPMYLVEYILSLLDVLTSIAVLPKNVFKFPVYLDFLYLSFLQIGALYVVTSNLDFL